MLDGRNNRFFFPWEQMFFLMQIIFIVLPSNMAAVQNLYLLISDMLDICQRTAFHHYIKSKYVENFVVFFILETLVRILSFLQRYTLYTQKGM